MTQTTVTYKDPQTIIPPRPQMMSLLPEPLLEKSPIPLNRTYYDTTPQNLLQNLNQIVGAPKERDVNSSQNSFLVSNVNKYSKLERIPRIITKFIYENFYFLRWFLIIGAVLIGLLILPATIAL
jgi:hypothetical protein